MRYFVRLKPPTNGRYGMMNVWYEMKPESTISSHQIQQQYYCHTRFDTCLHQIRQLIVKIFAIFCPFQTDNDCKIFDESHTPVFNLKTQVMCVSHFRTRNQIRHEMRRSHQTITGPGAAWPPRPKVSENFNSWDLWISEENDMFLTLTRFNYIGNQNQE